MPKTPSLQSKAYFVRLRLSPLDLTNARLAAARLGLSFVAFARQAVLDVVPARDFRGLAPDPDVQAGVRRQVDLSPEDGQVVRVAAATHGVPMSSFVNLAVRAYARKVNRGAK